jgi:hypothetical protein
VPIWFFVRARSATCADFAAKKPDHGGLYDRIWGVVTRTGCLTNMNRLFRNYSRITGRRWILTLDYLNHRPDDTACRSANT